MTIVRLTYYSRATRDMNLSDLRSILQSARNNNDELEVCGMLCYENRYFLQVLEGERETVNELYLDIADDPRHDDITIISYKECEDTGFGKWQMGYAAGSDDFYTLLRENGQVEFDPSEMTPHQAESFLQKMAKFQTEI